MAGERNQDIVLPIESYFPKDVLPTAHFLSRLPGFDTQYPWLVGARDIPSWNGKTEINGVETVIRIGSSGDETKILLDKEIGRETWVIDERYSDQIEIRLESLVAPVTVLLPNHVLKVGPERRLRNDIMFAKLYFKGNRWREWRKKDKLKPSDYPLIVEDMIDIERSNSEMKIGGDRVRGFQSSEQAIEALGIIKQAIIKATSIFVEDPAPNPDSNSLVNGDYFPK